MAAPVVKARRRDRSPKGRDAQGAARCLHESPATPLNGASLPKANQGALPDSLPMLHGTRRIDAQSPARAANGFKDRMTAAGACKLARVGRSLAKS